MTATQEHSTSHYDRIGGAPSVRAAVELFYGKVLADPELAGYFTSVGMGAQRRHLALMLAVVLGGPNEYTGRDLATAHNPLNIPPAHYVKVGEYLVATLTDLGVPADIREHVQKVLVDVQDQVVSTEDTTGA